jgi:tartrate dehydrogenase/decarboxylase/D-malate dehydrogenase
MREYRIAVIPGDGIGPEVIEAGLTVLKQTAATSKETLDILVEIFPWGSDYFRRYGRMMPSDALKILQAFDAIYFGAVGDPGIADDVTLWGLRLAICQGFDQYANVRPARILPGIESPLRTRPEDLDFVIVRENTEGEYSGSGGRVHRGFGNELGLDVSVFTRGGCERIQRFAFRLASERPRRHLTLVTKSNAQRYGMVLWDEVFEQIRGDFSEVSTDRMLVDALTTRMVLKPASLDVLVASNLHADILSDLAAALTGSIGMAPTANLQPEGRFPSMFEPIHGSAYDIAGQGIANPIGAFWTAAMMLEHLGERPAADRLMAAVSQVTESREVLTPDLGGTATTQQLTSAVCTALASQCVNQ